MNYYKARYLIPSTSIPKRYLDIVNNLVTRAKTRNTIRTTGPSVINFSCNEKIYPLHIYLFTKYIDLCGMSDIVRDNSHC